MFVSKCLPQLWLVCESEAVGEGQSSRVLVQRGAQQQPAAVPSAHPTDRPRPHQSQAPPQVPEAPQ